MSDCRFDSGDVDKSDEFIKAAFAQECYTNAQGMAASNYGPEMFSGDLNSTKTTIQEYGPSDRVTVIKLRKDDTIYLSEAKTLRDSSEASALSAKIPSPKNSATEEDSAKLENDQIFEEKNKGYEYPDGEAKGTFAPENMINSEIYNDAASIEETVQAVCNIPKAPNSLRSDYDDITCSSLCKEEERAEVSTSSCSMPSKEGMFASPVFPPPRARGRPQVSMLNVQKTISNKYTGTPYPHIVPRGERSHIPHEQIPQWTLGKTLDLHETLDLEQTPQAVDVVFSTSGDSGPVISSVSSGASSSSTLNCSSSEQDTSSSSVSDFLSSFDVSQSSDEVVQNLVNPNDQSLTQYENSSSILQYFIPVVNERENHNVKERKRRSRVSSACTAMRNMIPGMSEKTDKASVFEQAVEYVSFIKRKVGLQLDQAYVETLFQKT